MTTDYGIQLNATVNGNLINIRANDGADLAEKVRSFAENSPQIFTDLGSVAQAALAHGVFTGNAATPAGGSTPAAPRAAANTAPGETPKCPTHGPMKDMKGKRTKDGNPMRNRYYCSKFGCKDVSPQGEWIE